MKKNSFYLSILQNYTNELLVALGSIIISFSAVFVKVTETAPAVTGVYRMGLGGMLLLAFACFQRKNIRPSLSLACLACLGGGSMGIDIAFWHYSIHHVGPGLATVLGNCQVFLLTLIGLLFYKEQVRPAFFLSIPIAMLGLFCLVGHKWDDVTASYRMGVLQGLVTAIFYAIATTVLKKTRQHKAKLDPISNLAWFSLASSVTLALIAGAERESFLIPTINDALHLFFYALFSQVIGWQFISIGIQHIHLSTAGFLILLQPSLSFFWDIIFFHRPTPLIEMIGAGITLFAIYISVASQQKKH